MTRTPSINAAPPVGEIDADVSRAIGAMATEALSPAATTLLQKTCRPEDVRALVRSHTTIDVGLWFRWRRVWVCGTDDRLILLAEGPRPFVQSVPYRDLRTSFYGHLSGELVCVPAHGLAVRSLAMGPAAAWGLLGLIHGKHRTKSD